MDTVSHTHKTVPPGAGVRHDLTREDADAAGTLMTGG